jgi:hypothetical protein
MSCANATPKWGRNTVPLFEVIIPFRDRGTDPLRGANLAHVVDWWENYCGSAYVVSDGRGGRTQFNRSAAYNRGIQVALENLADIDGFIFAESDMIPDSREQIDEACEMADEQMGLVVPFSEYRYLSKDASDAVRNGVPADGFRPEWTMPNKRSIGAINIVSKRTMDAVGRWDEVFDGNWYDDDAMKIAFDVISGNPTRFVDGPAYHLYHLPGHRGRHLTDEDKAATVRNRLRLELYQLAAQKNNVARIRQLLAGDPT